MENKDVSITLNGEVLTEKDNPSVLVQKYTKLIEDANKRFLDAKTAAERANQTAKSASQQSAGLFQKKAAIEGLQGALVDQASATKELIDLSSIQLDLTRELSKISQATVYVSTLNVAYARETYERLVNKLKHISPDDKEKQASLIHTIKSTLSQISSTINLMTEQEKEREQLKGHRKQIDALYQENDVQDEIMRRLDAENDAQDALLRERIEQDKKHAAKISALYKENDDQDEIMKRLDEENDAQDVLLRERIKEDQKHAERISALYKENDDQDEIMKRLDEENDVQDELLQERIEQDKQHTEKISALYKENDDQDEAIKALKKESQNHATQIINLEEQISDQQERMDINKTKFNDELLKKEKSLRSLKNGLYGGYSVGIIAVIVALLSFIMR